MQGVLSPIANLLVSTPVTSGTHVGYHAGQPVGVGQSGRPGERYPHRDADLQFQRELSDRRRQFHGRLAAIAGNLVG